MGFQQQLAGSYAKQYSQLMESVADEADALAMRYFRADSLRVERKRDGTRVTEADRAVEHMAKWAAAMRRSQTCRIGRA